LEGARTFGDTIRRVEDTQGLRLCRQKVARPIHLYQMRPFVHEKGLAATSHTLGVRQRTAIPMPVLPTTLQAQSTLAASHASPTQGEYGLFGGILALLYAKSGDRLSS